MTLKTLFACALALPLLSGCAATLTLRNQRSGPVKHVEVRIGQQSYKLDSLAPGASDERKLKIKAGGDLNINYVDAQGHTNYTSSKTPFKKGDSRHWIMDLNDKTLLETHFPQ